MKRVRFLFAEYEKEYEKGSCRDLLEHVVLSEAFRSR
jgi:hypothetical protein